MNKTILCILLSVILFSCATKPPQYNDPIPLHDSFTILSKSVNESRVINVWTPPEYQTSTESLSVLYMPDGGVKEDFPHIANTLAQLIANKSIPPMILVGIENTVRKRNLTGPTTIESDKKLAPVGESANFRAFIMDELIPEINQKYRTTSQKGIIGESLAGLFVMETFFLKPDAFDFYIAMDPSLWWNNHYLDEHAASYLANLPDKKTRLWFASSSANGMQKACNNVQKAIQEKNYKNLIWKYADEPKEKHNTIFRATKEKAIVWILNVQ